MNTVDPAMSLQPTLVASSPREQRRHPRASLRFPVRLRWPSPLGQLTEVAETLDVSRGGLLVFRAEPRPAPPRLWVAFPFDPRGSPAQPEIPARVARIQSTPEGHELVAVEFETSKHKGSPEAPRSVERRASPRIGLAVPIRVRTADSPWPEEAMTVNVSDQGVLFSTTRVYAVDNSLHLHLPYGRWADAGEVCGRVARVDRRAGSVEQRVAVTLVPQELPRPQPSHAL